MPDSHDSAMKRSRGVRLDYGDRFKCDGKEYLVGRELGFGGFATVYEVVCEEETYALKVPSLEVQNSRESLEKFRREAKIQANISHPNVVQVERLIEMPNWTALLLEHVPDKSTLGVYGGTLSKEAIASVILQSVYALRAIHEEALHRDISPDNILITSTGHVKIADFGLAKRLDSTSQTLAIYGTPGCLPPERHKGMPLDNSSDLYSLGKSVASAIQKRLPEFVEVDELERPWLDIFRKLTKYEQTDRFSDCDSLLKRIFHELVENEICPNNLALHLREICSQDEVSKEAGRFSSWALTQEASLNDFYVLQPTLFESAAFDNDLALKIFDEHLYDNFFAKTSSFKSCDEQGELAKKWYFYLSKSSKEILFQRVLKTAVAYNRYPLMDVLRWLWSQNKENITFKKIVEEVDPTRIVRGLD